MSQNPSICHCFGPDCGAHVYIGRSRYTTQRAEGRYSFTDAVGDTYTKRILSSTRPTTFTLDFNSKEPAIVQVALEAPAADPRKQQPKEVWVLSTGSTASRPGYGEVWLPAELELVEDRRAGSAVPDAYAEQIYSRFAGAVDTGRDAMILALGRAGSAVPDAYAEQLYIERWEASTYRPMDRPAASRSTTTGDNSEMERVELMGWIDVRTADGWSPCWFELRFPALTYHERPGRPAVAAIADVAALQLEMGPTVEEELGRMFSWRMDTPDKTTDAEAAVRLRLTMAAAIVAGEDSDDAFLLVDEDDTLGAPAAAAVVVTPIDLLWNGAAARSQREFDLWTRALSRRVVTLPCVQLDTLDLELDSCGGIVGFNTREERTAVALGIQKQRFVATLNGVRVRSPEHYCELLQASVGSAVAGGGDELVSLALEGLGVFSRCSHLWHQLGRAAFEELAVQSVGDFSTRDTHERVWLKPYVELTEGSLLELLVVFPGLRELFVSSIDIYAIPLGWQLYPSVSSRYLDGGPPGTVSEAVPPRKDSPQKTSRKQPCAVYPTGVSERALDALRHQMPAVTVAHLGSQIDPATFDSLMQTYRSTKRIDLCTVHARDREWLTRPALAELLALCPDCEYIFFDQNVATTDEDLEFAQQLCPKLRVLHLGRAITSQTFEQLLSEYELTKRLELLNWRFVEWRVVKKAVLRREAAFDSPIVDELQRGEVIQQLETRQVGASTRIRCERGWTSVAARSGNTLLEPRVDTVAFQGLNELLAFCPEPVAIFTRHADLDMESLKLRCPSLQVAHLGREITSAAYDELVEQYATTALLDMTDRAYSELTILGLAELCVLCPDVERVYFHVSHAAITHTIDTWPACLPEDVEPGEDFYVRVNGFAGVVAVKFPEDMVGGQRCNFQLGGITPGASQAGSAITETFLLKQPQTDPIGVMMLQACPLLAGKDGAGGSVQIQVRELRRECAVLLEAKAAPEVDMYVVKSMAKLRDVADELETQADLIKQASARQAAAPVGAAEEDSEAAERVDCFRCDGTGRVREIRSEVTRAFVSEQELIGTAAGGEAVSWLFENEAGCWKLYSKATADVLEEAWEELHSPGAGAIFFTVFHHFVTVFHHFVTLSIIFSVIWSLFPSFSLRRWCWRCRCRRAAWIRSRSSDGRWRRLRGRLVATRQCRRSWWDTVGVRPDGAAWCDFNRRMLISN